MYQVEMTPGQIEYARKMDMIRMFYLLTYPVTQPIMWLMDNWRWRA